MAAQGAALQNHNNELVKCLEDLREKQGQIVKELRSDEAEKAKIQVDLQSLTKRLAAVNDSIARKVRGYTEVCRGEWRCQHMAGMVWYHSTTCTIARQVFKHLASPLPISCCLLLSFTTHTFWGP